MMKKKSRAREVLIFVVRSFLAGQAYAVAMLPVFVLGAIWGGMAGAGVFLLLSAQTVRASTGRNVALSPDYEDGVSPEAEGDPKIQYEAMDDDVPILEKRVLGEETSRGAHYEAGEELIVSPDPDFEVRGAPAEGSPR